MFCNLVAENGIFSPLAIRLRNSFHTFAVRKQKIAKVCHTNIIITSAVNMSTITSTITSIIMSIAQSSN